MEESKEVKKRVDIYLANDITVTSFFSERGLKSFVREWRELKYKDGFQSVIIRRFDMFSKSRDVILIEIDLREVIAIESRDVTPEDMNGYNRRKDWYNEFT